MDRRLTHPSVRASLRIGRAASAGLSGLAVVVAGTLVWALASAAPSSASAAAVHVATADRMAGPNVGLHARVRAVDAEAMTERTLVLVEAQQLAQVASMRAEVIELARKKIGTPYRAGAAGPNAFDCGGFTQFVFQRALGIDIGRSSVNQFQRVERIKRKDARPGDLVFFFENGAQHVGIYIGNGKMIDAPQAGEKVKVNPISGSWWSRSYTGMGRILPA